MLRLKELRRKYGITLRQMGEILGLAESTIAHYESGRMEPNLNTLQKIADYFGVTLDYLCGNEIEKTETKERATPDEEEIRFALFGGAKGITPEMYEEVKQFAEMVKLREEERKRREKRNDAYVIHRTAARGGGVKDEVMTREEYDAYVKKVKEMPDIHDPRL